MRIVLVCRVYPSQRPGGMPHVCADRAEQLALEGHDVHVLTTGGRERYEFANRVNVQHLPCKPHEYSTEFAAELEAECRRLAPDVLHLDSADLSRPWWVSRPGQPRVIAVTFHGFAMGGWLTKWNLYRTEIDLDPPVFNAKGISAEAATIRTTFDRVIGISLHEHTLLVDQYGVHDARLVYNPIGPFFFRETKHETDNPPDTRRFLCAAISGQSTRLFSLAEKAAEKAGVSVWTVQDANRDRMPTILDDSTGLVVPTAYCQGYDLTVAEAHARGKPVLASATGSYLREAQAGLPGIKLVPVGNVDALAEAMAGPLPEVPIGLADRHRPETHVRNWFTALGMGA